MRSSPHLAAIPSFVEFRVSNSSFSTSTQSIGTPRMRNNALFSPVSGAEPQEVGQLAGRETNATPKTPANGTNQQGQRQQGQQPSATGAEYSTSRSFFYSLLSKVGNNAPQQQATPTRRSTLLPSGASPRTPRAPTDMARRNSLAPMLHSTEPSNGIIYLNPKQEQIHRAEILDLFREQKERRAKEGYLTEDDDSKEDENKESTSSTDSLSQPTKSADPLSSLSRIKRTLSFGGAKSKGMLAAVNRIASPAPDASTDAPAGTPRHQRQRSFSNSVTPVNTFEKQRSLSFSSKTPSTPNGTLTVDSPSHVVRSRTPPLTRNNTDFNMFSKASPLQHSHHTRSTPQLMQVDSPADGPVLSRSLTSQIGTANSSPTSDTFAQGDHSNTRGPPLSHDGTIRPSTHSYSASAAARLESTLHPDNDTADSPQKTVKFVHAQLDHSPTTHLPANRGKNQQKKFWMPDKSVNKCYDCQSLFTVFKRKHHCRVCGQIFCWKCSNNFVDGEEWNFSGRIRVCNFCFATHKAAKERDSGTFTDGAAITTSQGEMSGTTTATSLENALSADLSLIDDPPTKAGDGLNGILTQIGDTPVFMSKSISNLSLFNAAEGGTMPTVNTTENIEQTLNDIEEFDKSTAPSSHTAPQTTSTSSADIIAPNLHRILSSSTSPNIRTRPTRTLSQVNTDGETLFSPSLTSPSPAVPALLDETSSRMDIALTTPTSRLSFPPQTDDRGASRDFTSDTSSQGDVHFDSVATLSEADVYYSDSDTHDQLNSSLLSSQSTPQKSFQYQSRTQSIIHHAQDHLRSMVKRLLLDEKVSEEDTEEWLPILVDIAWRVVTTIRIDVNQGDKMDIRQYVNIKTIQARNSSKPVKHAEYINGVVFRGNVVNRHMRTHIRNPSILLIKSPIQFYRHPTRMTSFDVLLPQEYDYLTLLVEKIAEQRPDIVFVHKSVSRIAQDLLLKRSISLVCNTKLNVMQRISRASQIPILNTVDELELAASRHQLNDPIPEHRCIERTEQRQIDYSKGRTKTLFVLRTRKQDTEGTVLLKSNDVACLKKVKKVLQFAIYVAYNVRLEAALCVDSCGTFLSEEEEQRLAEQEKSTSDPDTTLPYSSTPVKTLSHISASMNISIPMYPDDLIIQQAYDSHTYNLVDRPQFTSPFMHQNIVFLLSKIKNTNVSTSGSFFVKDTGDTSINALYTPPETVVIAHYTPNDMSLGQYLMSKCFHAATVEESRQYARSYAHNHGKLIVEVEKVARFFTLPGTNHEVIMMWSVCKRCGRCVTPLVPMTAKTYNYSFGKFLEVVLYDNKLRCNTGGCNHLINRDHVRYFGFRDMMAKFTYQPVHVYEVVFPSLLIQYDEEQQSRAFMNLAERLVEKCDYLFQRYNNILSSDDLALLPTDIREEMLSQQRSLMDELHNEVIKSKHIYALNRFTRSLYVHAKEWNRNLHQYSAAQNALAQSSANLATHGAIGSTTTSSNVKRSTMSAVSSIRVTNMIASVATPSKNRKKPRKIQRASAADVEPLKISRNLILVQLIPTQTASGEDYIRVELSVNPSFAISDQGLVVPSNDANSISPLSPPSPAPIPVIEDIVSGHMIHSGADVFVYDNEPSSIIAYTLHSKEYQSALAHNQKDTHVRARLLSKEKFHVKQNITSSAKREGTSQPRVKRSQHHHTNSDGGNTTTETSILDASVMDAADSDSTADLITSPRKSSDLSIDDTASEMSTITTRPDPAQLPTSRVAAKTLITCTVYYSRQFSALRQLCCNGDENFIYSLARCVEWKPTGGKSGSLFVKSWDDRYVIKHVPRVELLAFLEKAPAYFEYMAKTLIEDESDDQKKLPTVLVKILGVYKLSYMQGKKLVKQNVIVMENLFYNAQFDAVFDLKGSLRNRFQKQMDAVKLDENLLREMQRGYQLATRESEKERLTVCIYNDTLFLSKLNVMDYSLLVGVDNRNERLLVGIIDYVRQYTWDKQLETLYKSTKLVGKKKVPTVISPKLYKTRFREAAIRYFPSVLTHFNFSQMSIVNQE